MGSSGGSSSYSVEFPSEGTGGKGDWKAGAEGGGAKGGLAAALMQQQHSRTASEISGSVSGSSIGVWEHGLAGAITHPSKFPLVLVQVCVFALGAWLWVF